MHPIAGIFSSADSYNTDMKEIGTQWTREAVQIWNGLCQIMIGMSVPIDGVLAQIDGGLPIGGVQVING